MIGRVKLVRASGYGFILCDNGEEFFFHFSKFRGDWDKMVKLSPPNEPMGPEVQFKPVEHARGPRAIDVEMIEEVDE